VFPRAHQHLVRRAQGTAGRAACTVTRVRERSRIRHNPAVCRGPRGPAPTRTSNPAALPTTADCGLNPHHDVTTGRCTPAQRPTRACSARAVGKAASSGCRGAAGTAQQVLPPAQGVYTLRPIPLGSTPLPSFAYWGDDRRAAQGEASHRAGEWLSAKHRHGACTACIEHLRQP